MGEVRVNRAGNDLAVKLVKLLLLVRELHNLSWAHESEIEWVEEKDNILSLELLETDLLELLVPPGHTLESWGWVSNDGFVSFHVEMFYVKNYKNKIWIRF